MRQVALVPAFNESQAVAGVVSACRAQGFEVCVIDDGSSDDTAAVAARAGATTLRLPINVGVGGALRTGFAWAVENGYERVVQVDGDGQHDTSSIGSLLAEADASGAQLVIGNRFADGTYRTSATRRRMMRWLAALVSRRIGVELDDVTSGFRVISEPLLHRFSVEYPTEFLSDTVEAILLAHESGAAVGQAPVTMHPRTSGKPTASVMAAGHLLRVLFSIAVKRPA